MEIEPETYGPVCVRSRRPRGRRIGILVGVMFLFLSACAGDGDDQETGGKASPIVVGAAVAESGLMVPFDQPALNAFKLGVEDINAEGGINGRKLELMVADTQSDIPKTPAVAEDLIARGAQVLLASCDFDFGAPAANVAQEHGLVSFSLCTASPKFGVQGIGDKAYTLAASVGNEAATLATYAIDQGWKNAYLLVDTSLAFSRGLCSAFEKFFPELDGNIVGRDTISQEASSFTSQINRLAASDADAVLVCSYPPGGGSAVRALRASGIDLPLLAGNAFNGSFWVEAAPGISDFYTASNASTFADDPDPAVNKFTKEYVDSYGEEPLTTQAVVGYAITQVLKEGVEQAGVVEGEALSNALDGLTEFQTLAGPVTFTSEVHIPLERPLDILQFTDGEPGYVTTVDPEVDVTLLDGAN